MTRTIILALTLIASYSQADTVYRCQSGDKVTFSQIPCQSDKAKSKQLDYPNIPNSTSSETAPDNLTQNKSSPNSFLLSKKKERSIAKIKKLEKKRSKEIDKIKAKALNAGVNRAGSRYLTLVNKELAEVHSKYQKSIDKEQRALEKIEQEINQ